MSGRRVARAGLQSLGGTGGQMLVQVASLTILARLLPPADFGVYGMAMTFIGFTAVFRDLGLSSAAVQAPELSEQSRSNLWWINTVVGGVLMTVTLAAAPFVGAFFHEPLAGTVVALMAPTLLLAGATVQYQAGLMRDMRFGVLAGLDLGGAVLGLGVSVSVALAGGGVWALVLPQLVAGAVSLAGAVLAARWCPRWPRRGHGTRELVTFGGAMFGAQTLTYLHRNADAVMLGRLHGVSWTGQFNRASQLTRMPIGMLAGPFSKVALATLAPHQGDPERLGRLARHGQVLLAIPVLLVGGALAAGAEPIVALALGGGWERAVPFVQLIAVSEALALMPSVGGWILTARGLGSRLIRLGMISTVVKLTLIGLGTAWGPYGIVAGVLGAQLLLWPLSLTLVGRMSGVPTRAILLNSYVLVAVVGAASALGWWAGGSPLVPSHPPFQLAAVAVGMLTGLLLGLVVPSFRRDVRVFATTVRSGLGRGGSPAPSTAA